MKQNLKKEVSVSEVTDIFIGGTPKTSVKEYWDGDILWASAKDVANCESRYIEKTEKRITQKGVDNSAAKILPKDTIVITSRGTVGKICLLPIPMSFNQTCYGLVVKKGINPLYLFYKLKSMLSQIDSLSYGTVFDTITKKTFDELKFSLPSENEQRAIASILSSLDDKIALNHQMNTTLEAIGQALFKHWFVDFEFPDGEGKPYRSSGGEMVETELGEVPAGWRVGTLGEICAKITDGSHLSPKESDGNHLIATVRDLGAYDFDLNSCKKISDEDYQKLIKNGCRPEKGDILFSKDGTMGITHLYFGHQDIVLLSSIAIIRPKNNIYSNYIYSYLKSSSAQSLIFGGFVSGSALPRLVLKDIKKIPVLIPPEKLIMRFNKIFNNPLIQIIENEIQSRTLAAIRDTLLPKLMSGEIRMGANR